jgi:hypothetical protein
VIDEVGDIFNSIVILDSGVAKWPRIGDIVHLRRRQEGSEFKIYSFHLIGKDKNRVGGEVVTYQSSLVRI